MTKLLAVPLAAAAAGALWLAVGKPGRTGTAYGPAAGMTAESPGDRTFRRPELRELEALLASWPQLPKQAARAMIEKYGAPDELSARRLVWNDNGPWKRTIVRRDAGNAVLEQVAAYRVPNDGYELLSKLPGDVDAERGREELSAKAGSEPLHFLALNLADEVLSGKRRLDEARAEYDRSAAQLEAGRPAPLAQGLLFAEPDAPQQGGRRR
jgi:hypothetical protein